ncbi:FAD-dependent oxidoreductase [Hwanghaeella grinnelliae]|uniref:FAD-dependent oxidoreductase n=1 Tax=Hwanghaeella grinnelliae TaxID=2500179 RepID=A0A437QVP8_9PROT|nr:NADPH-dependent 2,4-dienoyl-CoA reductase [Hwanghaeella grinnelliae]RVU38597.1 FAD-dependent oxidoreductase [Hwanghaeella grinnelliae]
MSSPNAYPCLLSPIDVGPFTLPNRVIMGSMHTGLEGDADGLSRLAEFYRARAEGGVGLIITGGHSPNRDGNLGIPREEMATAEDAARHRVITSAVHDAGGRIALQVLHAGRYSYHDHPVSASPIRAPINKTAPRELTDAEVEATIDDFATATALARDGGYDGVELMGSEGYLITQFLASRTNHREDEWGGPLENRMRFATEIVRRSRAKAGDDCLIVFRLSVLDLVEGGLSGDDIVTVSKAIEAAGANILNSGIGWHEARIPTIAQPVPGAAFAWAAKPVKDAVGIPVVASNRIHTPEDAEKVIAGGMADMVSMARPFLADPDIVRKAASGDRDGINLCIACNQACLDHYFVGAAVTCLVNPAAAREGEFTPVPATIPKKIAVVGGGMAGLSAALTAARRGHAVTLFEAGAELGGQFNLAKHVPGKAVFADTIAYFRSNLDRAGAVIKMNSPADAEMLKAGGFDDIILATGVAPRVPDIPGVDHPSVITYPEALTGAKPVGERVAVIGAGGIGYDVSLFLVEAGSRHHVDIAEFNAHWGIDSSIAGEGGLTGEKPKRETPPHKVTLLKRSEGPFGRSLGRTTGWVHRIGLQRNGVETLAGVSYDRIDDDGLHITLGGESRVIPADTIVLCAGQDSRTDLVQPLLDAGIKLHVIGGAKLAAELDAKRAIEEGTRLGLSL